MIQLQGIEEITVKDIPNLMKLVDPVLQKRQQLNERLNRNAGAEVVFYSKNDKTTKIPFEQFITAIATGYLAGKAPVYSVNENDTEERNKIIEDLLDKKAPEKTNKEQIEVLLDYITKRNNDGAEHFDLTKNALGLTSCYEIIWEDENNDQRYKSYSPLQTVAIYDYTVENNLIGLVRKYQIKTLDDNVNTVIEIIDKNGTRTFNTDENYKEVKELDPDDHQWGEVPAVAYESDFSIFETVVDIIKAFEQLIQNNRNTFEYNDSGCKLKIVGFSPNNPSLIEQTLSDGKVVKAPNPDRIAEDNFILQAKVFYIPDQGDINWITKDINDTAIQNTIKLYMELITMMSCVPNITDTGFTNADNNSAIKNKYFALNQKMNQFRTGLEKMYMKRWEIILNRINEKKNKNFDFRDIKIDLPVNVPTNEQEEVDNTLKLKDIVSEETLITKLGFNYQVEKEKMDNEAEENFEENMNNIKTFNKEGVEDDNIKNIPVNDNINANNSNINEPKAREEK